MMLPARIVEIWDSAYAHVDYAAHGVAGRLDEIVELVRLKAVVRFGSALPGGARPSLPSSPAKSAGPSPTKTRAEDVVFEAFASPPPQEAEPPCEEPAWKAFASEFKKTRTGYELDKRQQEIDRLKAMLEAQKSRMREATRVHFTVDEDLLGLVVGSKGMNLAKARQIEGVMGVEIDGHEVQVLAATPEAGDAARDVLEYLREAVPISPEEIRLLIGKGGKNVRDIQAKCKLFSIHVSETGDQVHLVGNRKAVELGKRAIQLVVRFTSQQKTLWQDTQGLIKEVRAIPFGKLLESKADMSDASLWRDKELFQGADGEDAEPGQDSRQVDTPSYEIQVAKDKVGVLIGTKGATINGISQESRCRLTIGDAEMEGEMASVIIQPLPAGVSMFGSKREPAAKDQLAAGDVQLAVKLIMDSIDERARLRKEGIYPGAVMHVSVTRVLDFGAFVALKNGKEGLVHISELDYEHVESVSDYLSVDDTVYAVVLSVDERGRARLSLKDVDQEAGTFHGTLAPNASDTSNGSQPAPEPVSLDDKALWPSLDAAHNGDAGHSSSSDMSNAGGNGAGSGGLHQTRQEWKSRIREQREKAAREASNDYGQSTQQQQQQQQQASHRRGDGRQREGLGQPGRQMRSGGGGSGVGAGGGARVRMQDADGDLAPRYSRQAALADQDYRCAPHPYADWFAARRLLACGRFWVLFALCALSWLT